MSNSCHFLLQKQGGKRHYLKIHWPKTFHLTLSIRGSNQIERIKCKSRDIAQGRVHDCQTHHWNSVCQSAGDDSNAENIICLMKNKIGSNNAGADDASRPISSSAVWQAKIKHWTTDQIKVESLKN
jgi:hypothetical protein